MIRISIFGSLIIVCRMNSKMFSRQSYCFCYVSSIKILLSISDSCCSNSSNQAFAVAANIPCSIALLMLLIDRLTSSRSDCNNFNREPSFKRFYIAAIQASAMTSTLELFKNTL